MWQELYHGKSSFMGNFPVINGPTLMNVILFVYMPTQNVA